LCASLQDKKSKHRKKGHDLFNGGGGGSSSGDEGRGGNSGGGRRRQQWVDLGIGGDSSGDEELGAGGGGKAGGGGGAVRQDWMTKPAAARTKTDAQLAAEEEREAKAAEKRRLDPNAPFVSVSSARLAAVVFCAFVLLDEQQQLQQEHCHLGIN
jgi:hypothetical protein